MKGQDTKSGRVSGLGVAKWSFVRQVSILATEWGIKEQSLYGIEGSRCSEVASLLKSKWLQSGPE